MSEGLRLSVLDQSPISEGSTGGEALRSTLELARLVDGLGYHRYWVAEHHGSPTLASPSPEVLVGLIAAATSRLRVGSGGVLLPHYSPFKVAETFSMLAGLFPGRIDLGIGRSAGSDALTAFALQRDRREAAPDDFPQQLAELLGHLADDRAADHPFAPLGGVLPGRPEAPVPWLLGSSFESAIWAAQLGLPYAFGDFIQAGGEQTATAYRERFTPSARLARPHVAVAVRVLCAETDEEAQQLASSDRMTRVLSRRGELIPVPSVEQALAFLHARPGTAAGGGIVGAPATVAAGLEELARRYGAEEVLVLTVTYAHAARRRSYELLASAFGLAGTRPRAA